MSHAGNSRREATVDMAHRAFPPHTHTTDLRTPFSEKKQSQFYSKRLNSRHKFSSIKSLMKHIYIVSRVCNIFSIFLFFLFLDVCFLLYMDLSV